MTQFLNLISLEEFRWGGICRWESGSLDPTFVECSDVVPLVFKLVAEGPHEHTLDQIIHDVSGTLSESFDVSFWEMGGVSWALSVLDG